MTEMQELNAKLDALIIDIKICNETINEFRDENHALAMDNLAIHKRVEELETLKDEL